MSLYEERGHGEEGRQGWKEGRKERKRKKEKGREMREGERGSWDQCTYHDKGKGPFLFSVSGLFELQLYPSGTLNLCLTMPSKFASRDSLEQRNN